MNNRVQTMIPESVLASMTSSVETLNTQLAPYYTALSNEEKVGMRTMSTAREGYAHYRAHCRSLPRDLDPAVLSAKLSYQQKLFPIKQKLQRLSEMVAKIEVANGVDIMRQSDELAAALQGARNRNSALDEALARVNEWNQRFAKREADAPEASELPLDTTSN